jgi:hypothetical protein
MPEAGNHEPLASELEIASIVDSYREAMQRGDDPDPQEWLGAHPDLAKELADCLHGLAAMEELRNALSAVATPAPFAPRSLGDFQLVREIGRGGMGVVYEAIDVRLHRTVALKRIKAGILADAEELAMFRKEARAAAALQHPNIVQLHEVGEDDGHPYLVLEYVNGGGLDAKLAGTPIDPYEAAQLLATLAQAMHYAHENGIVHRDLKPANVLLTNAGVPKITDFGLAKHLHGDLGHTQTGTIKGTASYMASEQATGGTITELTDVYALGAILYEALTGRPPFRGATPLDTLTQVTTLEPVPPSRMQPNVPRDLETICLKCLQKEPQKRYDSAQSLADDLGRFMRHEPIHARPVGVGGRVWRWCRRNPIVAALLGLAASQAVLVMVLLTLRLMDEETARERILAENVFAANHLANTILVELLKLAEAVDKAGNDPKLLKLLKDDRARMQPLPPDKNPAKPRFALPEEERRLQPYLEKIHRQGERAFHSWHVVDKDGILLADSPPVVRSVFGVCFQGRDYFIGANAHLGTHGRPRVHISRAYQSSNDDLFKFTLSALVYDDDGKTPVGVVCATLPTNAKLGLLDLTDAERKHTAVIVGQADTNHPNLPPPAVSAPPKYMILVHPAYDDLPEFQQGKQAVVMPETMLPLIPRRRPDHRDEFVPMPRSAMDVAKARHEAYEDPLAEVLPSKYGGRWLAGFAQVGNSEMVVIEQRQRPEWTPPRIWLLAGVGGLLVAGLAALAWRRFRTRRVPAKTPLDGQATTIAFTDPPLRAN